MKTTILCFLAAFLSIEAFAPHRPTFRPSVKSSQIRPHILLFAENKKSTTAIIEETSPATDASVNATAVASETKEEEKELTKTEKMMEQVKEAGIAGFISYALWEWGFWAVSVPVVIFGYREVTGHWPDLSDKEDIAKLSAEAFAFVNFARFAVPLRIGLALSTTPWIEKNIVERFLHKDDEKKSE